MNFKKNGGFTLVELIVVIAILGLLAGIGIPAYSGYVEKAGEVVDNQQLAMLNNVFLVVCAEAHASPDDVTFTVNYDPDTRTFSGIANVGGVTHVISMRNYARGGDVEAPTGTNAAGEAFAGRFNSLMGDPITFKNDKSETELVKAIKEGVETAGGKVSGAYDKIASDTEFMNSIQTQIDSVKGSAFATIGTDKLLSQVTDVASLAADLISKDSTLTDIVSDPAYIKTMASKLNITEEEMTAKMEAMLAYDEANGTNTFGEYMANSTVLNVANTMNNMTAEEETAAKNNLASLSFGNLGTTLQNDPEEGLAQAALLYGMYTAFDPEGAKDLVSDFESVDQLMNLGSKTNSSGKTFQAYIAEINTSGSQAAKDYEGYKAALDIVNQSTTKDKDVANQAMTNGYSDKELNDLMKDILGS